MGRSSVTLAVALAAVAGCHGPSKLSPLARLGVPAIGPSREAVAQANPFRRASSAPDSEPGDREPQEESPVVLASHEVAGRDWSTAEETAKAPHDPVTRKLIDDELKDAPPEERAQFERDLAGLRPEMVREVLRIRRVVRHMGQDAPSEQRLAGVPTLSPPVGDPAHNLVQQTGGELRPAPQRQDAGLGAVDPWNRVAAYPPAQPGPNATAPPTGGHSFDGPGMSYDPTYGHAMQPGQFPDRAANRSAPGVAANTNPATTYGHTVTPPTRMANGQSLAYPPGPAPINADRGPVLGSAGAYGNSPPPAPGVEARPILGSGPPPYRTAATTPNGRRLDAPGPLAVPQSGDLPLPQLPAGSWGDELQQVIGLAEADVVQRSLGDRPSDEERKTYIEKHVYLRMLYLMAGQQERALTAIPGIDAADQEFWQQTFWAMANYFDVRAMPDSRVRAAQTIAQLRKAVHRLQENANLDLRNVAFCHKIASFGNYDRFDRDEFSPGQPVLVYAEVGNFKSEPTVDGQFRTILRSTVEVYKAGPSGDLVERMEFPATKDLCRNYRRDYFHSYEFTMPQKLSLGPHVMKLTVEDQLSRKVATYTLNFTVK